MDFVYAAAAKALGSTSTAVTYDISCQFDKETSVINQETAPESTASESPV